MLIQQSFLQWVHYKRQKKNFLWSILLSKFETMSKCLNLSNCLSKEQFLLTSFPKGDIMRVNILRASIGRCPCYSGEEKRLYPAGYLIAATKNKNKRAFKCPFFRCFSERKWNEVTPTCMPLMGFFENVVFPQFSGRLNYKQKLEGCHLNSAWAKVAGRCR